MASIANPLDYDKCQNQSHKPDSRICMEESNTPRNSWKIDRESGPREQSNYEALFDSIVSHPEPSKIILTLPILDIAGVGSEI